MATELKDLLHNYLDFECEYQDEIDGKVIGRIRSIDAKSKDCYTVTFEPKDNPDDWRLYMDAEPLKFYLKPINEDTIDDEVLAELWVVIGGTIHLFEFGKDDLKQIVIDGSTEDPDHGLQLDIFTMRAIVDKMRELRFDIDGLIPAGYGIDITANKPNSDTADAVSNTTKADSSTPAH